MNGMRTGDGMRKEGISAVDSAFRYIHNIYIYFHCEMTPY